jgi:hypothetical protein
MFRGWLHDTRHLERRELFELVGQIRKLCAIALIVLFVLIIKKSVDKQCVGNIYRIAPQSQYSQLLKEIEQTNHENKQHTCFNEIMRPGMAAMLLFCIDNTRS